jgi:hypothetical protein
VETDDEDANEAAEGGDHYENWEEGGGSGHAESGEAEDNADRL